VLANAISLVLVLALSACGTMDTTDRVLAEAEWAVLRSSGGWGMWPGSVPMVRIWQVDGQVAGQFETKAKLAPGLHTVGFGMRKDVTGWWLALASGGLHRDEVCYLGEVRFVAAAGGRYILQSEYDATRPTRARAWVIDEASGETVGGASLERVSVERYNQSWNPVRVVP